MNANKQDAGGLPELPETIWLDSLAGRLYTADQMRAYGELCRAAPAGGDPTCPECEAPGLLFECVACSHSNYPQDSAPAGSGEVEKLIDDLIDHAFNDGNEGVEFRSEQVNTARAALLRKLQQGAE